MCLAAIPAHNPTGSSAGVGGGRRRSIQHLTLSKRGVEPRDDSNADADGDGDDDGGGDPLPRPRPHPRSVDNKRGSKGGRGGRHGGVAKQFPGKLHEMLDRIEADGLASIVSWQPHGRAFVVHRPHEFVTTVMPTYFRQSKFASFQRQLNLYGFQRITRGRDKNGYYHDLFRRGEPELSVGMARIKVKGTKVRRAPRPDEEPDFYAVATALQQQRGPPCPPRQPGRFEERAHPGQQQPLPAAPSATEIEGELDRLLQATAAATTTTTGSSMSMSSIVVTPPSTPKMSPVEVFSSELVEAMLAEVDEEDALFSLDALDGAEAAQSSPPSSPVVSAGPPIRKQQDGSNAPSYPKKAQQQVVEPWPSLEWPADEGSYDDDAHSSSSSCCAPPSSPTTAPSSSSSSSRRSSANSDVLDFVSDLPLSALDYATAKIADRSSRCGRNYRYQHPHRRAHRAHAGSMNQYHRHAGMMKKAKSIVYFEGMPFHYMDTDSVFETETEKKATEEERVQKFGGRRALAA